MKVLLDTNIVIHREASRVVVEEIGILFRWLDRLHYEKYLHPVTIQEINKHKSTATRSTFDIKLTSYSVLNVVSPLHPNVVVICTPLDKNENDSSDTLLINEVYNGRIDALITEDKKLQKKAELLGLGNRVFNIDSFLEKVIAENPELADYKVLSVKKEFFGNVDLNDEFFNSLREDYPDFESWFNTKSQELAYICRTEEGISAFLYLKVEGEGEPYPEIEPPFPRKKRLKVGTFKTALNRHMIGERLLKVIFDNALNQKVDEIYVTTFENRLEQQWLVKLLKEYGFIKYGIKRNEDDAESVFVRDLAPKFDPSRPKLTYPYISRHSRVFIVPIYPKYHTNLFPDSILRTESPQNFVENAPFRNAISKVYISRSYRRDLRSGDLIVFYRTGGFHFSVVSTIGIVESVVTNIGTAQEFIALCRVRSVFSTEELLEHWNYSRGNRPFVVNFVYAYTFPKRINLKRLIELGVIHDVNSAPRGFELLSPKSFDLILKETNTNDRIVVD